MNTVAMLVRQTPEEALAGSICHAARALGLAETRIIRADLAIWDVEYPAELPYRIGFNPLRRRIFAGAIAK